MISGDRFPMVGYLFSIRSVEAGAERERVQWRERAQATADAGKAVTFAGAPGKLGS
jgi:hypothetical protein